MKWEDQNRGPIRTHLRSNAGESTTLAILSSDLPDKTFYLAMTVHIGESVDDPLAVCQDGIMARLLPLLEAEVERLRAEVEDTT